MTVNIAGEKHNPGFDHENTSNCFQWVEYNENLKNLNDRSKYKKIAVHFTDELFAILGQFLLVT